jgi:hypothetical protein
MYSETTEWIHVAAIANAENTSIYRDGVLKKNGLVAENRLDQDIAVDSMDSHNGRFSRDYGQHEALRK